MQCTRNDGTVDDKASGVLMYAKNALKFEGQTSEMVEPNSIREFG